jgi:nitrite reductase/ring-hydroxylating ferredoxin subunit
MPFERVEDCNRENIARLGGRLHSKVKGRFITVLLHRDQLYCIDSCCFHASGPLGEGPVMDIEDIPTIRCQWHNFIIALDTGERVTQEVLLPGEELGLSHQPVAMSFPLRPQGTAGKPKRGGEQLQRVHAVREVDYSEKGVARERWPIEVEISDAYPAPVRSDVSACNQQYARMCMTIQQRRIDSGALVFRDGAGDDEGGEGGEEDEAKKAEIAFYRTLLHSLQATTLAGSSRSPSSSSPSPASSASTESSGAAYRSAPGESPTPSDASFGNDPNASPNGPPGNPRAPTPPPPDSGD